jgi:addiction module HigA family antidote
LASGQTGVTPDTALRLGKFFNTTPEFWMTLQASHDLKVHAASLEADLAAIRQYEAA